MIRLTDHMMSLITAHYSPVISCSNGAVVVWVWMLWRWRIKLEFIVQHVNVCQKTINDVINVGVTLFFSSFLSVMFLYLSCFIIIKVLGLYEWPAWWAVGFSGRSLPCLLLCLFFVFLFNARWQINMMMIIIKCCASSMRKIVAADRSRFCTT